MARAIDPKNRMNPAHSIIEECGGVAKVAEITESSEAWVHRWTYPESRSGTAGRIPQKAQAKLIKARARGEVDFNIQLLFGIAAE